jgi:hypothetical protein
VPRELLFGKTQKIAERYPKPATHRSALVLAKIGCAHSLPILPDPARASSLIYVVRAQKRLAATEGSPPELIKRREGS